MVKQGEREWVGGFSHLRVFEIALRFQSIYKMLKISKDVSK